MNDKPTIIYSSKADWKDIVNLVAQAQKEISALEMKTRHGKPLNLMELITKKANGGTPEENYAKALSIIGRYVNLIDIDA